MSVMRSVANDNFERIASEADKLSRYSKNSALASREIQTAVHLMLPGELTKARRVGGHLRGDGGRVHLVRLSVQPHASQATK